MLNEESVKNFLNDKVSSGELIDYALVGLNENSIEARIKKLYFGDIVEEFILVIPYLDSFRYYKITEKPINYEETDSQKIIRLDDITNQILDLISENLPKSSSQTYMQDKTDLILSIWKYIIKNNPNMVDSNIIDGFNNLTIDDSLLTDTQKRNKWDLQNWINKLNARHRIEIEVGDTLDQMADISKRVGLMERMLLRLFLHVTGDLEMTTEIKTRYGGYASPIIQAADSDEVVDRIDLEDELELIQSLEQKRSLIKDIVKEEYIDKIK